MLGLGTQEILLILLLLAILLGPLIVGGILLYGLVFARKKSESRGGSDESDTPVVR